MQALEYGFSRGEYADVGVLTLVRRIEGASFLKVELHLAGTVGLLPIEDTVFLHEAPDPLYAVELFSLVGNIRGLLGLHLPGHRFEEVFAVHLQFSAKRKFEEPALPMRSFFCIGPLPRDRTVQLDDTSRVVHGGIDLRRFRSELPREYGKELLDQGAGFPVVGKADTVMQVITITRITNDGIAESFLFQKILDTSAYFPSGGLFIVSRRYALGFRLSHGVDVNENPSVSRDLVIPDTPALRYSLEVPVLVCGLFNGTVRQRIERDEDVRGLVDVRQRLPCLRPSCSPVTSHRAEDAVHLRAFFDGSNLEGRDEEARQQLFRVREQVAHFTLLIWSL